MFNIQVSASAHQSFPMEIIEGYFKTLEKQVIQQVQHMEHWLMILWKILFLHLVYVKRKSELRARFIFFY